jgi:hypothetical protein
MGRESSQRRGASVMQLSADLYQRRGLDAWLLARRGRYIHALRGWLVSGSSLGRYWVAGGWSGSRNDRRDRRFFGGSASHPMREACGQLTSVQSFGPAARSLPYIRPLASIPKVHRRLLYRRGQRVRSVGTRAGRRRAIMTGAVMASDEGSKDGSC